jgi:hydroxylamine dehydrogenase
MNKRFVGLILLVLFLIGLSSSGAQENACIGCHTSVGATKGIINDWKESKHALNNITCDKCHEAVEGDNDAFKHNGFLITKEPSSKDCSKCHPNQVNQFSAGKHSLGWTMMQKAARYKAIPNDKMRASMCEGCHSIGKVYEDGSAGKCDSCHTRHVFSKVEARQPEACETCHMGLDHEQIEYYKSSKHGVIFDIDRNSSRAPTCMTCHMDTGTHDVSQGITVGTVSQGAFISDKSSGDAYVADPNGIIQRSITMPDFKTGREKMLQICSRCHSTSFVKNTLENADEIKIQADKKVGEGIAIIQGLYQDGLLDPMPENRPLNPVTGINLPLTGQQTYSNTSGIEAEFFETYKYALIHSWKGAYHMNPDYAHWYGWAQLNLNLEKIKSQNRTIRRLAALEAQTSKGEGTKAAPGFEAAVVTIAFLLLAGRKH